MADKPAPSQARGLSPFKNVAAESHDSWTAVNDESATPYVKLLAWRIAKLSVDGLKGIDTSTVGYPGGFSRFSTAIA
jgi:hypothetical protein